MICLTHEDALEDVLRWSSKSHLVPMLSQKFFWPPVFAGGQLDEPGVGDEFGEGHGVQLVVGEHR